MKFLDLPDATRRALHHWLETTPRRTLPDHVVIELEAALGQEDFARRLTDLVEALRVDLRVLDQEICSRLRA